MPYSTEIFSKSPRQRSFGKWFCVGLARRVLWAHKEVGVSIDQLLSGSQNIKRRLSLAYSEKGGPSTMEDDVKWRWKSTGSSSSTVRNGYMAAERIDIVSLLRDNDALPHVLLEPELRRLEEEGEET